MAIDGDPMRPTDGSVFVMCTRAALRRTAEITGLRAAPLMLMMGPARRLMNAMTARDSVTIPHTSREISSKSSSMTV